MSLLFSPYRLGPLELANRIVVAPMCQYSCVDGLANDWHLMHLGQLALSGAGLLIIEATAVTPEGRITPHDLGLYDDATQAALKRVLDAVRRHSSMPLAIQISHAGRKASSHAPWDGGQLISPADGGWTPQAPSAIAHLSQEPAPQELDRAGLQRLCEAFVATALRAKAIGIDVIELHAAHGYLLHQFLSPLSNQRQDEYGGSTEGRMRFPLQVLKAVLEAVGADMPVGMRISATDWVEGGWDLEQSVALGHAAKALGCSFMHVSSGGLSPLQKIPLGPGYQVPFAQRMKAEVGLPTMAVGLITEARQAEAVIEQGQADLVALARTMLYNPHWPWHAAAELGASVQAPKQYWRSQPRHLSNLFGEIRIGQR